MLTNQQIGSASYPVFSKNLGRESGKDAWNTNLRLASLAASKIASCLGPMGAYKLVTYYKGPLLVAKVTKDAVDVVDELGVQYPAVKTLTEAAKIQRQDVGEGVSSLLVLISALLEEAEKLIQIGIHPVAILDGYLQAANKSIKIIDESARAFAGDLDESLLNLVDCGRGLLNGTLRQALSQAVKLAEYQGRIDLSRIKIEKKLGGSIEDSHLVRGIIIKKEKAHRSMPDWVEKPRIALVNKGMEVKPFEQLAIGEGPFPARLNITESGQLAQFKGEESALRTRMVEKVKASGANVLICRSRIEERVADKLSRQGIFAMQMVDQKDMDEVGRITGARTVADVNLLEPDHVGTARRLEVDKIPPEQISILHADEGASLLLRGSSPELVEELERTVRRAILVLKHARAKSKVIPGGGAIFVKLALQLRKFALTFAGKQQLAVKAFADALEIIPKWLSTNYGLDPIDTMMQLRKDHSNGMDSMGVGEEGSTDMGKADIVELASVNQATIWRTFEVASLLLKIDDCFYVKDLPVFHKQ
jgi:archaeal chaperonin